MCVQLRQTNPWTNKNAGVRNGNIKIIGKVLDKIIEYQSVSIFNIFKVQAAGWQRECQQEQKSD